MFEQLDGKLYKQLINYGIRNLKIHEEIVNDLNVFPVPDGDTGTNMTMTLTNGFNAIRDAEGELSELAKRFAYEVAFGARGNSGVISSQFFKGFSETFTDTKVADVELFISALNRGVTEAYKSVSRPTEGTILTVVREATEHVNALHQQEKLASVLAVIDAFLDRARESLENTPELLPVLKNAGVVDSGGAGILYFFKGMKKYMMNESLEEMEEISSSIKGYEDVDYSVFHKTSKFEYGYCTELLIQLLEGKNEFDYELFKEELEKLGDSVATVFADDKVKVHIHTGHPDKVLKYCHQFGEFLTLKIENMSVQHEGTKQEEPNEIEEHRFFAVVATASDGLLEKNFKEMGVAITIPGGQSCNPSVQEFVSAFERANADHIIVFPNNKNVILTANQAKKLYDKSNIIVINSKSMAECYSALGLVDFDSKDVESVVETIEESIRNIEIVSVTKAVRNAKYDNLKITVEDFVAIDDSEIMGLGKSLTEVVLPIIDDCLTRQNKDVVTLFAGKGMSDDEIEVLTSYINDKYLYTDCGVVKTDNEIYYLTLAFE